MADFISMSKTYSARITSIDTIMVVADRVRLFVGARSYDFEMTNSGETPETVAVRLARAQKDPRVTLTIQELFSSTIFEHDLTTN